MNSRASRAALSLHSLSLQPLLLICTVVALLLPMPTIPIDNNAAVYLSQAAKVAHLSPETGVLRPETFSRGPVYASLLVVVLKTLGWSPESAVWAQKVLLALTFFISSCALLLWGGLPALLLGGALLATSPNLLRPLLLIDTTGLLAFWGVALLLFALHPPQKARPFLQGALLGLLFSAAFLTKETALFWLPALLFAYRPEKERSIQAFSGFFVMSIACLSAWFLFLEFNGQNALSGLGIFNPQIMLQTGERTGSSAAEVLLSQKVFGLFWALIQDHLFFLAPALTLLLPIAVLLGIRKARSFTPKDHHLVSALAMFTICSIPTPILDLAAGALAPRQSASLCVFLVFLVAVLFVPLVPKKLPKLHLSRPLLAAGVLLIAIGAWGAQGLSHGRYRILPRTEGRMAPEHRAGALWLSENLPEGSHLTVDGTLEEILQFYAFEQFQFKEAFRPETLTEWRPTLEKDPLVLIATRKNFRASGLGRMLVFYYTESQVRQALSPGSTVVLSDNTAALADYFAHSNSMDVLFKNEKFIVFRVKEGELSLPELRMENVSLEGDLNWMSKEFPEDARTLRTLVERVRDLPKNKIRELKQVPDEKIF